MQDTTGSFVPPRAALAVGATDPATLAQVNAAFAEAVDDSGRFDRGRKIDFYRIAHDYQRRAIEFADRKATFVVFGANAMASFLEKARGLSKVRDIPVAEWTLSQAFGQMAILSLILGGGVALWVIVPRIGRRIPKGALYWEAIRQHKSVDEWTEAMEGYTEEDTNRLLLRSIYELAGINVSKYRSLQAATRIAGIGMVLAVLNLAL